MGLGPLDALSLADAREQAREARKLVYAGLDPIDQREKQRQSAAVEAARGKTFGEVAEELLASRRDEWRNPKHADIDTALVLSVLEPIWKDKPESASRLRGRIDTVISYAAVREYRSGDNPARWRGHLEHMLQSKTKAQQAKRERTGRGEHHPALPYAQIPACMAACA
jgi:hypothetical protein